MDVFFYALTAKEQMGHADIQTSLSIYTHLSTKHKDKQVNKLDAFFESASQMQVSEN
jgi:integrase